MIGVCFEWISKEGSAAPEVPRSLLRSSKIRLPLGRVAGWWGRVEAAMGGAWLWPIPDPSRCSRGPAHPHPAPQSGPGPTPRPHNPQGHRGYLEDSTCVLFVLLRIPTLPAPGPGSEPDASLLMFKEHISWWRGFGRKGPEKQNRISKTFYFFN